MQDADRAAIEDDAGFSLIELLVVVMVVGVLASIAMPSFLDQRMKGQDACAKAMVKQMQSAMMSLPSDSSAGVFTGTTTGSLTKVEPTITAGGCGGETTISVGSSGSGGVCNGDEGGSTTFCVAASSSSGTSFAIVDDGSLLPHSLARSCSNADAGGCSASGTW
ncbi:MAG: prepilin-type N-terminal cleavage/methylation domain-containing protein [Solirubrobacterales bacterium]